MSSPDFICIGPGRAGTTWLYEVLLSHPEVEMAKGVKETEFFDNNYEKGLNWYASFFSADVSKVKGEITNRYIFDTNVPNRIYNNYPSCKIIVCYRNPLDRLISNYYFKLREGDSYGNIEEFLDKHDEALEELRYFHYMKKYLEIFPSNQIHVMQYKNIAKRPEHEIKRLFNFLNIDESWSSPSIYQRVNAGVTPRSQKIAFLFKKIARFLRQAGLFKVLTYFKRSALVKKLFFKPSGTEQIKLAKNSDLAKLVDNAVSEDIKKFETIFNLKSKAGA